MQIKHYLALALIAVTDETAPAGGIFKVELIYTIYIIHNLFTETVYPKQKKSKTKNKMQHTSLQVRVLSTH